MAMMEARLQGVRARPIRLVRPVNRVRTRLVRTTSRSRKRKGEFSTILLARVISLQKKKARFQTAPKFPISNSVCAPINISINRKFVWAYWKFNCSESCVYVCYLLTSLRHYLDWQCLVRFEENSCCINATSCSTERLIIPVTLRAPFKNRGEVHTESVPATTFPSEFSPPGVTCSLPILHTFKYYRDESRRESTRCKF